MHRWLIAHRTVTATASSSTAGAATPARRSPLRLYGGATAPTTVIPASAGIQDHAYPRHSSERTACPVLDTGPESRTTPFVIPAKERHPVLDTGPESRRGGVWRSARANLAHQCANTLSSRSPNNLNPPRTRSKPTSQTTDQPNYQPNHRNGTLPAGLPSLTLNRAGG